GWGELPGLPPGRGRLRRGEPQRRDAGQGGGAARGGPGGAHVERDDPARLEPERRPRAHRSFGEPLPHDDVAGGGGVAAARRGGGGTEEARRRWPLRVGEGVLHGQGAVGPVVRAERAAPGGSLGPLAGDRGCLGARDSGRGARDELSNTGRWPVLLGARVVWAT